MARRRTSSPTRQCPSQRRSVPSLVDWVDERAVTQQRCDHVEVPLVCRGVEAGVAFAEAAQFSVDVDAVLEQELDDNDASVRARDRERLEQLRFGRARRQLRDAGDIAKAGRFNEANRRAATGQILRGLRLSICQPCTSELSCPTDPRRSMRAPCASSTSMTSCCTPASNGGLLVATRPSGVHLP